MFDYCCKKYTFYANNGPVGFPACRLVAKSGQTGTRNIIVYMERKVKIFFD